MPQSNPLNVAPAAVDAAPAASRRARILLIAAACLLFAGAYYQNPLFTDDQNTYFLKGLARAGYGHLSADWCAQQTDIVPVFSAIVFLVQSSGSHWMFYALHGVIAAVYAASLFAIARRATLHSASPRHAVLFFALLAFVHSTWLLLPLSRLHLGADGLRCLLDLSTSGMAGQYILGRYLEPSDFGVLLLASLAFFLHGRTYTAVVCAVAAATVHTSLILHAGILTAAYMTVLAAGRDIAKAAKTGALALLLILPAVFYIVHYFVLPDSQAVRSAGEAISVDIRQPHHAQIFAWFSASSCLQLAIIAAGILVSRRCKRLFSVLLFCAATAAGLTLLQALSGSPALALLFPWRTSAWLIPACTALLLGKISMPVPAIAGRITAPRLRESARLLAWACPALFLVAACIAGLGKTTAAMRAAPESGTCASRARMNYAPGQSYLIPPDLQGFRLAAGVPVFVDWKSMPNQGGEIIEWYSRVRLADEFYGAGNAIDALAALARIRGHAGITHIVLKQDDAGLGGVLGARFEFADGDYIIYSLPAGTHFHPLAVSGGPATAP